MITGVIGILNKHEIQNINNEFVIYIDALDNLEDLLSLGVELNKHGYDIDNVGTQDIFTQTTIINVEKLIGLKIVPHPEVCGYCETWNFYARTCSSCGMVGCKDCMDTRVCKDCGGVICDDCLNSCHECDCYVCDDCVDYNDDGEGPYCNECLSDIENSSYEWE